ncbi:MAG: glycosyltransferase [Dehalococcoidia bacterium]|nr:glycosyltransferase [Dehalococcoidia bacterium]
MERVTDNLYVYTPIVALHEVLARRVGPLLALDQWLLRAQIKKTMRALGFSNPSLVAWIYHPYQLHYVRMLHEALTVYECYDEHSLADGVGVRERQFVTELEEELFARCDLSFTTSRRLRDAKAHLTREMYVFNNAADIEYFGRAQDPAQPIALELRNRPHPVIGYLGFHLDRADLALIRHIALARPHWTLVLTGVPRLWETPSTSLFHELSTLPNVLLKGWIDWDELPSWFKGFDIGIIPYKKSGFHHYVNPNKLHEYTAMGKPVVSTSFPDVESHKDIIWIAKDYDDFVRSVEDAYATDSLERISRRLEVAQKNSWAVRVRGMLDIIQSKFESEG